MVDVIKKRTILHPVLPVNTLFKFCANKTFLYLRNPFEFFTPIIFTAVTCPDGGIGRRAGLKNQWEFSLAGSIPAPGTLS